MTVPETVPAEDVPATASTLPPTEQRLAASRELDRLATVEVLNLLNEHDAIAVQAVAAVLPQVAEVVDEASRRFRRGGAIHYFGAGTSGRLGVLDAAELVPTFNLETGRVVAHIAGGDRALTTAIEDAEDSIAAGAEAADLLGAADLAIGLAASGNTPYVGGALARARDRGAYTVLVSSNPKARFAMSVDANIVLDTGAEVLTGSTRLKAATAEKLFLNGFSTALMVRAGRTWSNLMVSLVATNAKLRDRTVRILEQAAGISPREARTHLDRADGDLKTALVCALAGVAPADATNLLEQYEGSVGAALAAAARATGPVPRHHP